MSDVQKECEPCLYNDEHKTAKGKCIICDELLCESCSKQHRSQKMTRQHEIQDVKGPICEPCQYQEQETEASSHCENCCEYLCTNCASRHCFNKLFRNHIVNLLDQTNGDVKTPEKTEAVYCGSCTFRGVLSIATSFCIDCDNSEPMCGTCSAIHISQKCTREHRLSNDFELFRCSQGDPNKESGSVSKTEPDIKDEGNLDNHELYKAVDTMHITYSNEEDNSAKTADLEAEFKQKDEGNLPDEKFLFASENEEYSHVQNVPEAEPEILEMNQGGVSTKQLEYDKVTVNIPPMNDKTTSSADELSLLEASEVVAADFTRTGKPSGLTLDESSAEYIKIKWRQPLTGTEPITHYEIRYKEEDEEKWIYFRTDDNRTAACVTGLKSGTSYVLQVRAVDDEGGGLYGERSTPYCTKTTPARRIMKYANKLTDSQPCVYQIPVVKNNSGHNSDANTSKFIVGVDQTGKELAHSYQKVEKTIMLVGAKGCGKSMIVNAIVNYLLGVSYEDEFRFSIFEHLEEYRETDGKVCYTIPPFDGSPIEFPLNIIDTRGFGEVGEDRGDDLLKRNLSTLFQTRCEQGVEIIDCVCMVMQSSISTIDPLHNYVIETILSVFGQDIKDNIVLLPTFYEGVTPAVLAALEKVDLQFLKERYFPLNNAILFNSTADQNLRDLQKTYWRTLVKSIVGFLQYVQEAEPRSLQLSTEVMKQRKHLAATIQGLKPEIDVGVRQIVTIKQEALALQEIRARISINKDYEYTVSEERLEKIDLEPGKYVTNCITCNRTCHYPCRIPEDKDKAHCAAMDTETGYCTVCVGKCYWNKHFNHPYRFDLKTQMVTKTQEDLKKKYFADKKLEEEQEDIMEDMKSNFENIKRRVTDKIKEIQQNINRLQSIALKPKLISVAQYLELLIHSEEQKAEGGFVERVRTLTILKDQAFLEQNLSADETYDPWKNLKLDDLM